MADKMAVMNGGFLQQYDSPANVFANPVNTFVAGFVGSPAMSLIPLEVDDQRRRDAVLQGPKAGSCRCLRPNARKAQAASIGKVVLGARHSTLKLHRQPSPGAVPGKVYTVEPTGDVTFVQVYLGRRGRRWSASSRAS